MSGRIGAQQQELAGSGQDRQGDRISSGEAGQPRSWRLRQRSSSRSIIPVPDDRLDRFDLLDRLDRLAWRSFGLAGPRPATKPVMCR